jgi:flagellar motor switch/type III secretory pathway protein FliN
LSLAASDDPLFARMGEVRCAVDFIIGTGTIKLEECLRLRPQSVIPLIQSAGSDLRVEVQGVAIATGEIVIINDSVALRISRMLPPVGTESA